MYLVFRDVEQLDAIAFPYGTWLIIVKDCAKKNTVALKKDVIDPSDHSSSHKSNGTPFRKVTTSQLVDILYQNSLIVVNSIIAFSPSGHEDSFRDILCTLVPFDQYHGGCPNTARL